MTGMTFCFLESYSKTPFEMISMILTFESQVSRPRGYKTFFMLNSVEHEILNAHKYKDIKIFGFFMLR